MWKKQIALFLAVLCAVSFVPRVSAVQEETVRATACVLMDARNGEILFEKNADLRRSMASTTKILTALILLEAGDLQKTVTVRKEMIGVEGTSLGLRDGDKITRLDLCYGLLLTSGNDAANVIAWELSGGLEAFARRMNDRAAALGMTASSFVTPSGLDAPEHYTTARDMAILASFAMQNTIFRQIVSSASVVIEVGDPPVKRTITNHNKLLSTYEGCDGLKTGYTKKSGRCLVSSAVRNGVRLICVTLQDPDDWNDHRKLLDNGFARYGEYDMTEIAEHSVPVTGGSALRVGLRSECARLFLTAEQAERVTSRVLIPPFAFAPVNIGDPIGKVCYCLDGSVILQVPLVAVESSAYIQETKADPRPTFWKTIYLLLTS